MLFQSIGKNITFKPVQTNIQSKGFVFKPFFSFNSQSWKMSFWSHQQMPLASSRSPGQRLDPRPGVPRYGSQTGQCCSSVGTLVRHNQPCEGQHPAEMAKGLLRTHQASPSPSPAQPHRRKQEVRVAHPPALESHRPLYI